MRKLKEGKLDRKWFWCIIIVIWMLVAALLLIGTNPRAPISNDRLLALTVLLVLYVAAIVMRLRDTGKSLALLIIFLFFPIFIFVIGCWESEQPHWGESENDGSATSQE